MVDNMGQVVKEKVTKLIELIELKPRVTILLMNHKDKAVISQLKVLGMDKEEMGEMKIEMIKRSTEILGLVLKMIVMEESDTEDSYELEITPQQLSQVTPGGGALKIKLSRKKPLQITAGAPERKSGIVPMKPENIQSSKQPIPSSHVDTFSENTQVKRRVEAPLLITPKHLGNNIKQQKGIPIKGENDLRNSNDHRLARERGTQEWSNESRGDQDPNKMNNPPGNGGGDSSGGTSGDPEISR